MLLFHYSLHSLQKLYLITVDDYTCHMFSSISYLWHVAWVDQSTAVLTPFAEVVVFLHRFHTGLGRGGKSPGLSAQVSYRVGERGEIPQFKCTGFIQGRGEGGNPPV